MPVTQVGSDGEWGGALTAAGSKLVVVDFFATWCGPCTRIAPKVEELSGRFPQAVFLKVDVDKCRGTAQGQGVSAMPTFAFFHQSRKLDTLTGGDPAALEAKVVKWVESVGSQGDVSGAPEGQMELSSFLDKTGLECLNEDDAHSFRDLLGGGALHSDCDEQLIINMPFNQPIKLHSILIRCSQPNGPRNVKLFINNPTTLDFDGAEATEPVQHLILTPEQLREGAVLPLKYVKFQNVRNLQLFVQDNQDGSDKTSVAALKLFGSPINATNMSDFKRVAGKKGEGGH